MIANQYFGYAPYVREMNIWLKHIDEVIIVAPLSSNDITSIDLDYLHPKIDFRKVPNFNFTSIKNGLISVLKLPIIFWKIFWAMNNADHIHLRCPGNVGLIGCLVQIFFPHKKKTAKYAGNWDPKSAQPWTYRLQKWLLSNTFLTKNIQVLVYGEWSNQTKNILPFFTASYSETEKKTLQNLKVTDTNIRMVFAGTLVEGKNPLYAIEVVKQLCILGYSVVLDLYGEGKLRAKLENFIKQNNLQEVVFLHGNQSAVTVKKAYQNSHFVILASKSEGWPKVIAEGMFWGCVPLATPVSCVSYMLGKGERGVLLEQNLIADVKTIQNIFENPKYFERLRYAAVNWSQTYTLEKFNSAIQKLI
ncbi:glycosyltransferase [Flavobacterium ajazii]|uniref:glycosyltransferase n=1 Tax=Flavobacterium ajazii TaxID=2692318 RepID=UPI001FEA481E|nr:glycosyltransferase [Flavobacterium ajazii]